MVVMMGVHDEASKAKIIRTVAKCHGITSITMDSQDGKLTVIGDFNLTKLLTKLERKWSYSDIATFGTYDPKKEAEVAAAAEKKKKEEMERQRLEGYRGNQTLSPHYPPPHYTTSVFDHDYHQGQGCVIT
ncbi:unnamed protein product [Microthlaspi erraticum]|uniref:HMA domain-containing protein n=1 Tax=Microthlaspi erraticum TaxID=1685480 RepID=A0A6D2KPD6_9BRAS|nr:unnamed protein product [Microthlaspi erraticum]